MNDWRPALEAALLLALLLAVVLLAARHWMVWPAERDEEDEDMRDLQEAPETPAMVPPMGLPVPGDDAEGRSPVLLGDDHGIGPARRSEPPGSLGDEPSEEDVTEWLHGLHDPIGSSYTRNHEFLMAARADADYVHSWIQNWIDRGGPIPPGPIPIHPGWHETELAAAGLIPNRTLGDQVAA